MGIEVSSNGEAVLTFFKTNESVRAGIENQLSNGEAVPTSFSIKVVGEKQVREARKNPPRAGWQQRAASECYFTQEIKTYGGRIKRLLGKPVVEELFAAKMMVCPAADMFILPKSMTELPRSLLRGRHFQGEIILGLLLL